MAGGNRGRVRTHDRDTNDSDAIIGSSLNIGVDHSTEVRNTNKKGLKEKCKRDYRNRIKRTCDFLSEEYPDYFAIGVRTLTAEDLGNPDMFYHKNKVDFLYTGLNVKFIHAFFAHAKKRARTRS